MSTASPTSASYKTKVAWWRTPHILFVPGILLLGVIATTTMVVISVMNIDPVLDKEVYDRERRAAMALEGQARTDALMAILPANQGRNHAASPAVPVDK